MAVETLYMSTLDKEKRTFADKKEADALDKKLELAEALRVFLQDHVESLEEQMAEDIGMLIAEHKTAVLNALKGKPDALMQRDTDGE